MTKRVQFGQVEFGSTFANEDYDRTAQEVAKLSYHDMVELLTMRSQWRRDMERMLADRATQEKKDDSASHLYSSATEICI
ncbi:uncharacterized protein BYT42DRAFT_499322 [Radiomyces spectabilis]|uniref:uncharacterized protein n=1 Tax=Radiomyces spectabilis TaxID=64574 RepID=UPI002220A253|nr:uncharacterized protein BYT42DRAFT_499322 [Radiomyces spectabilis]KAI8374627.1 hypothetical protein BYT42DRAFT_499322 [Radiomyces spectabilis]